MCHGKLKKPGYALNKHDDGRGHDAVPAARSKALDFQWGYARVPLVVAMLEAFIVAIRIVGAWIERLIELIANGVEIISEILRALP